MKKRIFFIVAVFLSLISAKGQTLPTFSSSDGETWYYIQFRNGNAVLQDMGNGAQLLTKEAIRSDAQLWKVVGSKESNRIVNKSGRSLFYDTSKSRFVTSSSSSSTLNLVATTNGSFKPAWEIHLTGDNSKAMNQFGGAGIGKELGIWDANDPNNPLLFIPISEIEIKDVAPAKLDEYRYLPFTRFRPDNLSTLWYTKPVTAETVANPWMEYALPIGNGQFGGMIYGGIHQEMVQFNEKTVWTGSATQRGAYQSFGNFYIEDLSNLFSTTDNAKSCKKYVRYLDLSNATAVTSWQSPDNKVTYKREYIASNPDNCIVIRLSASELGKINNKFYIYNAVGRNPMYTTDGEGGFASKLTTVNYNARFKVIPTGGTMTADESGITVKGADEVLIVFAGATNFDPITPSYTSGDATSLASLIDQRLQNAAAKSWNDLYTAHVNDYLSLFNRVELTIGEIANNFSTPELVDRYNSASSNVTGKEPASLMLEKLYFDYARYLLISSSRGVDTPANLQGIWNSVSNPPWESDIHSNINVQMNYWPAEATNLSELHDKFLNYIYDMAIVQPQWKQYAKKSGQTTGWTCFTQNNIFGHSNFAENYVIANAWYCMHLWQHYRYTLDLDYLKNKAFPAMKSCADFWQERLVLAKDGTYECPNEWSPENGPARENATAHAQQLTWDLFNSTLKAIEVLGADAGVTAQYVTDLKNKFSKLDDGLETEKKNGKDILREWKYSLYTVGENKHRHMSHLICLFPGSQVAPGSPYFAPAINSLMDRGDASTGWSMGWKINLWARALNGNHAHQILHNALRHAKSYGTDQSSGGIYYNLFDSHAPFQIDGNFGACSGVAEMLLQSHTDTIHVLPALPAVWETGSIKGLRAIGNFQVDEYWEKGKATKIVITSDGGKACAVRYPNINNALVVSSNGTKIEPTIVREDCISFPTTKKETYSIFMSGELPSSINGVISKDEITITANGRNITVNGGDVKSVKITNMEGKELMSTKHRTFSIPSTFGHLFIVLAIKENGSFVSQRVMLNN